MRLAIAAILWVAGLLIAGSDSPYMPWANVLGLVLFLCASIVLGKEANRKRKRYLHYD